MCLEFHLKIGKLETPLSKDQGRGAANSSPKNVTEIDNVLRSISSHDILAQDKINIMHQAVAKCSKNIISSKRIQISLLLDSGSEVSLICQSYFKEHLLPKIETPTGEKSDVHILFNLMVANKGQLPVKIYVELDINSLGLKVPNPGFLILEEPNRVLDKKHQTKLPGIIDWNLIQLTYKVFVEQYGEGKFNSFECPTGVYPLLLSQLCLYYYAEISKEHDYGCSLFTIRLIRTLHPLENWLTRLKKSPTIFY